MTLSKITNNNETNLTWRTVVDAGIDQINANTTAIATNATNITSNDTDIATNVTNIASNLPRLMLTYCKQTQQLQLLRVVESLLHNVLLLVTQVLRLMQVTTAMMLKIQYKPLLIHYLKI